MWTNNRVKRALLCGSPIIALLCVGCGNDASLSGQVTLDGKPLSEGQITFVASGLPPVYATIESNGDYTANTGATSKLKPGTYQAAVMSFEEIPSNSPTAPPGRKLITPERYSSPTESGFTVEVQPGNNRFDLELVTTAD